MYMCVDVSQSGCQCARAPRITCGGSLILLINLCECYRFGIDCYQLAVSCSSFTKLFCSFISLTISDPCHYFYISFHCLFLYVHITFPTITNKLTDKRTSLFVFMRMKFQSVYSDHAARHKLNRASQTLNSQSASIDRLLSNIMRRTVLARASR